MCCDTFPSTLLKEVGHFQPKLPQNMISVIGSQWNTQCALCAFTYKLRAIHTSCKIFILSYLYPSCSTLAKCKNMGQCCTNEPSICSVTKGTVWKVSPSDVSRLQTKVDQILFSCPSQFKCVILATVATAGQTITIHL